MMASLDIVLGCYGRFIIVAFQLEVMRTMTYSFDSSIRRMPLYIKPLLMICVYLGGLIIAIPLVYGCRYHVMLNSYDCN